MQCPACSQLNDASSARCVQCATTLIHEAVGHSAAYREAERQLDGRMYSGFGAIVGFFLLALLMKFVFDDLWYSEQQLLSYSLGGAVIGSVLGRLALHLKRRAS